MTIKVDLLTTERRGFGFDPIIGFLIVVIAICTMFFWLYGTTLNNSMEKKKALIAEKETKISEMENKLPVIEDLKKGNLQLESQINTVKSLVYDPIRYANLLQEVSAVLPPNVWISNLNIEPGTSMISFSGTAMDIPGARPLFSIATLMRNIQNSRYFVGPSLSSANQTSMQGRVAYSFQIDINYSPEAAAGLKQK